MKQFSNVDQVGFADLIRKATGADVTPGKHLAGGAEAPEAGDKVVAVDSLDLHLGAAVANSSEPASAIPAPALLITCPRDPA